RSILISICIVYGLTFFISFFYSSRRLPRPLHSFPTRRSSDLSHGAGRDLHRRAVAPVAHQHVEALVARFPGEAAGVPGLRRAGVDRKSTRLNSSHGSISYAVFCLKKKKHEARRT